MKEDEEVIEELDAEILDANDTQEDGTAIDNNETEN